MSIYTPRRPKSSPAFCDKWREVRVKSEARRQHRLFVEDMFERMAREGDQVRRAIDEIEEMVRQHAEFDKNVLLVSNALLG